MNRTAEPSSLAQSLRRLFEIGRHPLAFQASRRRDAEAFGVEDLQFATASGEQVRGILTKPLGAPGRLPAILYIHAHGNRYEIGAEELLSGRPALQSPYGPVLARLGYVTLCIDLPCFGTRRIQAEVPLSKALLWQGRSLAGRMLGELSSALDHLASRPDVDAGRIGAFGMSMGATFACWLAAVEPRLSAAAHMCCFADFGQLIASGAHDLHGLYLTVPGLVELAGNGAIAGLIAPRPQLVLVGDRDPLTPPHAFDPAWRTLTGAYRHAGADNLLTLHREADGVHAESAAMRRRVLLFLAEHLGGALPEDD